MGDYVCKCCDYQTSVKQNFDKHNKGRKHSYMIKLNNFYACNHCGFAFDTENKKYYHMRKCKSKPDELTKEKESEKMEIADKVLTLAQTVAESSLENAKSSFENAKTAGKSMNMMKYAMVHFKDAPPLLTLDQNKVHQMLEYDQKETNKPKD